MERSGVVPDLMCLGKGMGGGFPVSACIGTTRVMYSWGASGGEAIHTSTFLGNPLGCAAALAAIDEIEKYKLTDRSKNLGDFFRKELWKLKEKHSIIRDVRGAGLMIGMELGTVQTGAKKKRTVEVSATDKARFFVAECMRQGVILLLSGPQHNVISITPPLVISEKEILFCVALFERDQ